jgi:hypothetical protein
MVTNLS